MPIGVLTPVASMSTRFWIGIVQTLVQPGIWTARSSSPPNAASSSRSTFQSRSRRLKLRDSSAWIASSVGWGSIKGLDAGLAAAPWWWPAAVG